MNRRGLSRGLVVGTAAAAAQRLPGGVGGDVGHRLQVGLHLFAEVGQAFPVEEVAGEDRALRRRATLVVADRHADQQGRQVVDQQQLAQAVVGASAKVQRAEADGALLQCLEQGPGRSPRAPKSTRWSGAGGDHCFSCR